MPGDEAEERDAAAGGRIRADQDPAARPVPGQDLQERNRWELQVRARLAGDGSFRQVPVQHHLRGERRRVRPVAGRQRGQSGLRPVEHPGDGLVAVELRGPPEVPVQHGGTGALQVLLQRGGRTGRRCQHAVDGVRETSSRKGLKANSSSPGIRLR